MVGKLRNPSDRSNASTASVMTGQTNREYFWACDLTTDKRASKWHIPNDELEEDDEDYIEHTLVVRSVCLGAGAVEKEENIVVMESVGDDGEVFRGTVANLTKGVNPMVGNLSLTVDGKSGVTFTLVEGSGPVSICGNRLMEYPEDEDLDASQTDESTVELQDELQDCEDEDSSYMEEKAKPKQATKRKASVVKSNKGKQKAKMEEDDDEDDEDEDDDDEEDSEDDCEEEDSEEDVKAKKAKKEVVKNGKDSMKGKPKAAPLPVRNGKAKKAKK